jgi:hypothetical protein
MSEDNSNREPLPNREELFRPALEWAMNQTGGYLGFDLKKHLAQHLTLTQEQLTQTRADGTNRFGNRVDWVTAEFTAMGMHTGWNGQEHKSPDHLYFLTKYGYAVGERNVERPKANRHGSRSAKPDIRQLTEEQRRIAPWLNQNGHERSDLDNKVLGMLAEKRTKY